MPEIIVLRHGNTFEKGDVVRRVGACTDIPLSKSGRRQANEIADALHQRGLAFTSIVASPLIRAKETASIVAAICAPNVEIETAAFLIEIDYGPDENQPEDAVVMRIGRPALDAWERTATPPPGWRVDPLGLTKSWSRFFGECATATGAVLVVTSNGVARFARAAAGATAGGGKLRTAAYGRISVSKGGSAEVLDWDVRAEDLKRS